MKAVRHHPLNAPHCFPYFHPLLLTSPPLLDRQTKSKSSFSFIWGSSAELCRDLPFSVAETTDKALLPGGQHTSQLGVLNMLKTDLRCVAAVCLSVRVCRKRPVALSIQLWGRCFFTGIGWWDQGMIILKDVLFRLDFCARGQKNAFF